MPHETLYDIDYFAWTEQQAEALRLAARDPENAHLDCENFAEEIESLGRRDRREVEGYLDEIVILLLKIAFSRRDFSHASWRRKIDDFRGQLDRILEDSPSLRNRVASMIQKNWAYCLRRVERELRDQGSLEQAERTLSAYQQRGPFTPAEVLGEDLYPERGFTTLTKDPA